jgi:hypothetical protein
MYHTQSAWKLKSLHIRVGRVAAHVESALVNNNNIAFLISAATLSF